MYTLNLCLILTFTYSAYGQRFLPGFCITPTPQEGFDKSRVSICQTIIKYFPKKLFIVPRTLD